MKPRLVIAGAGGHAKVVAEILLEAGEFELAGTVSVQAGGNLLGLPALGGDEILPELRKSGITHAFPAIGDNAARMKVLDRLTALGFALVNAISSRAAVSSRTRLGRGLAVMPGAVINVDSVVEDGAIVNSGATVDHDCRIGRCAHIGPGVHVCGKVSVGEGALLGVGSCVIPDLGIGAWAVVGAGSSVIRDVPPGDRVAGVPATLLCPKEQS